MKKLILFSMILCLPTIGFTKRNTKTFKNNQLQVFDFNKAYTKAKKENKFLILDIYSKFCGYCVKMEKTTYKDKKVVKMINKHFIFAKIDSDNTSYQVNYQKEKYSVDNFLTALEIQGLPATGFLNKKGEFLTVLPGFIPAKQMITILTYIKDDCYTKKISFSDFMKNQKVCINKKA